LPTLTCCQPTLTTPLEATRRLTPVAVAAVDGLVQVEWWASVGRLGVEPFGRRAAAEGLVRAVVVVVVHPGVDDGLGVWDVVEHEVFEAFLAQGAVESLDLAGGGWRPRRGEQMLDAVLPADPVEQDLDRAAGEPAGEHLSVEFLRDVKWFLRK
jgi:hypothetical protein